MKILFLVFVFSICFDSFAQGEIPFNGSRNTVEYRAAGNTYTWQPVTGATPKPAQPYRPDLSGGTVSDTAPKATYRPKLPYEHKGGDVRAKFEVPINPRDVGKEAAKAAKAAASGFAAGGAAAAVGSLACAFICEPIVDMLLGDGVNNFKVNGNGDVVLDVMPDPAGYETSDGNIYTAYRSTPGVSATGYSREAACASVGPAIASGMGHTFVSTEVQGNVCWTNTIKPSGANDRWSATISISRDPNCPAGWYIVNGECTSTLEPFQESLENYMHGRYTGKGWDHAFAKAAAGVIAAGGNVFTDGTGGTNPGSITGPATVPQGTVTTSSPTSVIPDTTTEAPPGYSGPTQPGTKTTTKTKTTTNTYSGPKQTTGTSTTTITSITNNITNITNIIDTTVEESDDPPEEEPITDTPDPDLPELYKQKYPNGLTGVVSAKVAEIKATPLFQLPNQLMGNLPSTGSCPSWTLDLNLASWASLGTWNIGADCSVWAFGKICIIIGALMLARALITGG